MAELIGIFIGDGSLNVRKEKHSYEFKFTGNIHDEIPYFQNHVSPIASSLLNRSINVKVLDGGRSIGLYFCSKDFAMFLGSLGFRPGPKSGNVTMPKAIIADRKLSIACMRGIFDTDGCFTLKRNGTYPVITFGMKSRCLLEQMQCELHSLGIGNCLCANIFTFDQRTNKTYVKSMLSINGKENTDKWFKLIGTNNPKINGKYIKYKKGV